VGTASDDSGRGLANPTLETSDGDTTTAAKPPAPPAPPNLRPEEDEEEDRTIRTKDPQFEGRPEPAPRPRPSPARPARPAPALPSMTSKKATEVGLGGPVPRGRRPGSQADAKDDSVTATAPATRADEILAGIPGIVKIHEFSEDDDLDETEAQTLVAAQAAAAKPAATQADAKDDSVTAPAPTMFVLDTSPQSSSLPPLVPPAAGRPAIAEEEDDRPTERREVPDYDAEDDSVTTQAPIGAGSLPSPIENEPDLATGQVASLAPRRRSDKPLPRALDLDSDLESITGVASTLASARDEELLDAANETAVMPNAPAKPPRAGSDSGKRPDKPSGDYPNVSGLPAEPPRFEPNPYAATDPLPPGMPPALDPNAKKPNYALLVVIAAGVSFVLPILLYLVLSRGQTEPTPRAPSEVASDPVPRIDPVRPRKGPVTQPKKK
jgi:hypothetical protein